MTKYRLTVYYQDDRYPRGWYWNLHKLNDEGKIIDVKGNTESCLFRWSAILGGKRAARKHERNKKRNTPYTKEFTI